MTDVKRPISLQLRPNASKSTALRPHSFAATTTTTTSTLPSRDAPMKKFRKRDNTSCCSSTSGDSRGSGFVTDSCNSSNSSSSSSSCNTSQDSPCSPSMILPYLYVGDQAQTQVDTISSLNIRYILSLQTLPKFLDASTTDEGNDVDLSNSEEEIICNSEKDGSQRLINGDVEIETLTVRNEETSTLDGILMQLDEEQTVACDKLEMNDRSLISQSEGKVSSKNNEVSKSSRMPLAKNLLPKANSSKDYLVKFRSCVNKLIKGKCINISDTFETLVEKFFDETHNFIEEARRNKCNILVHCKAGISRSPTIAIAYLMKLKRLQLQDAYDFVKRCRPQISPNLNFMGQLMNYERKLLQRDQKFTGCPRLPSPTACNLFVNTNQFSTKSAGDRQEGPSKTNIHSDIKEDYDGKSIYHDQGNKLMILAKTTTTTRVTSNDLSETSGD